MADMKKCSNCGMEMPSDALFCPECGTRQEGKSGIEEMANSTGGMNAADSFDPYAHESQKDTLSEADLTKEEDAKKVSLQEDTSGIDAKKVSSTPQFQDTSTKPFTIPPVQENKAPPYPVTENKVPPYPVPENKNGFQYVNPAMQNSIAVPPNVTPAQSGPFSLDPQGVPLNPTYPPQQNMAYPQGSLAGGNGMQVPKPAVSGKKIPVFLIVVAALLALGMVFWFISFFSTNVAEYNFGIDTSRGVVFVLLIMSVLSIISTVILRVQLRGKKLAMLANVLLVLVIIGILFGLSLTEFLPGDLPNQIFMHLVP